MLSRPSTKVITALARLEGNNDFEVIREWLKESLQDLYGTCTATKDETLVRWQQGAAQTVADFLSRAEEARGLLHKSR